MVPTIPLRWPHLDLDRRPPDTSEPEASELSPGFASEASDESELSVSPRISTGILWSFPFRSLLDLPGARSSEFSLPILSSDGVTVRFRVAFALGCCPKNFDIMTAGIILDHAFIFLRCLLESIDSNSRRMSGSELEECFVSSSEETSTSSGRRCEGGEGVRA